VSAEIQHGNYNPHRAPFVAFATYAAREALRDDWQRRRALKRWTGSPPASLDHLADLGWERPSWSLGADPLRIVLAREMFREAIASLTRGQLAAVRAYQRSDEGQAGDRGDRVPRRSPARASAAFGGGAVDMLGVEGAGGVGARGTSMARDAGAGAPGIPPSP
jgi:hypothetical protein